MFYLEPRGIIRELVSHQASIDGKERNSSVVAEQPIKSRMKTKIRKKIKSTSPSKSRIIHVILQPGANPTTAPQPIESYSYSESCS
jgi:hypothetical protein